MSTISYTGMRKFTPSCSRCRASKLKCDRSEPCLECIKRNVGHLCVKDERRPRAKKVKTKHSVEADLSHLQEAHVEETAWILEQFVDNTAYGNLYHPVDHDRVAHRVAPDFVNSYWSVEVSADKQNERGVLLKDIVNALPEVDIIQALYEVFVMRCQGALANVVHTSTFLNQAQTLYNCLNLASCEAKVNSLSEAFGMETLACQLMALVLGLAFHPTPAILGWSCTPVTLRIQQLRASNESPKTWRSLALHCLRGDMALFSGSLASLQAIVMLLLEGQEVSLALDAVLAIAISGARKLNLHRLGDAKLAVTVSSSSSPKGGPSDLSVDARIRTEIGVRVWWALVMRDWSRGHAQGSYSIHTSQFDTRLPLHINDDDLYSALNDGNIDGYIQERPRSEFAMLSYTINALELSNLTREALDLQSLMRYGSKESVDVSIAKARDCLSKKYESFMDHLPAHFEMGSLIGLNATDATMAVPVHRWMLHQQMWSLWLRLYQADCLSKEAQRSYELLAHNIIDTQAQIQARCAVCGTLATNETQLFNAAIALVLGLLGPVEQTDTDDSTKAMNRKMSIYKIREAAELLGTWNAVVQPSSSTDSASRKVDLTTRQHVAVLEALLKLEEEEYSEESNHKNMGSIASDHQHHVKHLQAKTECSLTSKVSKILEGLQQADIQRRHSTALQPDLTLADASNHLAPVSATSEAPAGLDVLPMLYDDASDSLWQFLNFDPLTYD